MSFRSLDSTTKDPYQFGAAPPDEKPRILTPQDLGRYLDYCSEMLSLANKVAALFVQRSNDPQISRRLTKFPARRMAFHPKSGRSSPFWTPR